VKIIIASRGTTPAVPGDIRSALAAIEATAIRVNVDDDAVAGAMRLGESGPITTVVSVLLDEASVAVTDTVSAAIEAVAQACGEPEPQAWRVREIVRLDPAPVPDGQRSDVLANIAFLRRPEAMGHEDYLAHWLGHHTAVAIRTQNTSAYVQNVVEEALTPTSEPFAAIVEEHFPMAAIGDPHAFYGSRGDAAELNRRIGELMESVNRFGAADGIELVPTSRYAWETRPGSAG
jgi:hypothetical protein